jgi:hypothetical protein
MAQYHPMRRPINQRARAAVPRGPRRAVERRLASADDHDLLPYFSGHIRADRVIMTRFFALFTRYPTVGRSVPPADGRYRSDGSGRLFDSC